MIFSPGIVKTLSEEKQKDIGRYVCTYLLNKLPTTKYSFYYCGKTLEGEYCFIPNSPLPILYVAKVPSGWWHQREFLTNLVGHLQRSGKLKATTTPITGNDFWFSDDVNIVIGGSSPLACKSILNFASAICDMFYAQAKEPFLKRFNKLDQLKEASEKRKAASKKRGLIRKAKNFTKIHQIEIANNVFSQVRKEILKDLREISTKHMKEGYLDEIFVFNKRRYSSNKESKGYLEGVYYGKLKVDLTGKKLYNAIKEETSLDIDKLLESWMVSKNKVLRRFAITFSENIGLGYVDEDPLVREAAKVMEENKDSTRSILNGLSD